MRNAKCNDKCIPEQGLHWLGDRMMKEGETPCVGCGEKGEPHYGFATPCCASRTGSHYFTEKTAQRNAR